MSADVGNEGKQLRFGCFTMRFVFFLFQYRTEVQQPMLRGAGTEMSQHQEAVLYCQQVTSLCTELFMSRQPTVSDEVEFFGTSG